MKVPFTLASGRILLPVRIFFTSFKNAHGRNNLLSFLALPIRKINYILCCAVQSGGMEIIMIMPIDIQNKEFARKLKGYDCDEVDDFLDEVIVGYQTLLKENQSLKNKIGVLTKTVENYKSLESSLTKSVDMAKQTANDIKTGAKSEAQMIINNAKLDASRLAKQIDDEHIRRHNDMLKIKSETEMYKARVKSMCESLIKVLDDID